MNLYDQNSIDTVLKGVTKLFLLLPINPLFSLHSNSSYANSYTYSYPYSSSSTASVPSDPLAAALSSTPNTPSSIPSSSFFSNPSANPPPPTSTSSLPSSSPSYDFPYSLLFNRIKSNDDIHHIISFHLLFSSSHIPPTSSTSPPSSNHSDQPIPSSSSFPHSLVSLLDSDPYLGIYLSFPLSFLLIPFPFTSLLYSPSSYLLSPLSFLLIPFPFTSLLYSPSSYLHSLFTFFHTVPSSFSLSIFIFHNQYASPFVPFSLPLASLPPFFLFLSLILHFVSLPCTPSTPSLSFPFPFSLSPPWIP